MFDGVEAYQIAHFSNEEKKKILEVLKHYKPFRVEEDTIGRLFYYLNDITVVFEKGIEIKTGRVRIQVSIDYPCPAPLVESLRSLELVDEIMIVDENKKEVRIIEVKPKERVKSISRLNQLVKATFKPRFPVL